MWPSALQPLAFGRVYNKSIEEVLGPASLKWLAFRGQFHQIPSTIAGPHSLEPLSSAPSNGFDQPDDQFDWPHKKDSFDQPDVVLVKRLRTVTMSDVFVVDYSILLFNSDSKFPRFT